MKYHATEFVGKNRQNFTVNEQQQGTVVNALNETQKQNENNLTEKNKH